MGIALWGCPIVLAAVSLSSGMAKSTRSKERMVGSGQTGVQAYSLPFIRFIAFCELCGAVGLVEPRATSILPVLTPLAAIGLGIIS